MSKSIKVIMRMLIRYNLRNTIAVIDVYGDPTMIAAYGTISYSLNEEWLAFGHNYNLSGKQISKPVYPAKMITMIDGFPVARKLAQAMETPSSHDCGLY